jgi:hypothetical protein
MMFSSLNETHQFIGFEGENIPTVLDGIFIDSFPNIFGIKNKTRLEYWENHSELRIGLEYAYYRFESKGKTFYIYEGKLGQDGPPPNDAFYTYYLDEKIENYTLSGWIENKFTIAGLKFIPGFRSDYLNRSKVYTMDSRGLLSYEFQTETTVSAAAGKYSYFFQTNPRNFDANPDLAGLGAELKPERAFHRVVGIEQQMDLYNFKIEGFINDYWDMPEAYPHTTSEGKFLQGLSSGKRKTSGVEFLIRKDRREKGGGLFGWLSYTYTQSLQKTGLPTQPGYDGVPSNPIGDPYGDKWIPSNFEQEHSAKFVAGYILGEHTFSWRFQFNTSFPQTPIIGADYDSAYNILTGTDRWVPIYGGKNSAHYPNFHRLDLRYEYKVFHSWGYVTWYVEVINVYNNTEVNNENFDRSKPYKEGSNPNVDPPEDALSFFPGFGVEIKF